MNLTPETHPRYNLHALKVIFEAQNNFASGTVVNMFAACSPAALEADGWIEKCPGPGRWDGPGFKPTQKLHDATV